MQTATEPQSATRKHTTTTDDRNAGTHHRPTESAGTLAAAFSNQDAIKRSELYKLEIETAKAEEREPVGKKLFFQLVNASGYYLKKKRDAYYYCEIGK